MGHRDVPVHMFQFSGQNTSFDHLLNLIPHIPGRRLNQNQQLHFQDIHFVVTCVIF